MIKIYLKPGELYFSDQPAEVTTILGSCVAITMRHRESGLTAICHAVQPTCSHAAICLESCAEAPRYVKCVIPKMVQRFRASDARPSAIEVKLFGGAAIIGHGQPPASQVSVGEMNVAAARRFIKAEDLQLKVVNAGGHFGRKIIFDTQSGVVWMKKIRNNIN